MAEEADTRIIIVDTDPDFLVWAAAHLNAPGVSITTAERAEDAVAA